MTTALNAVRRLLHGDKVTVSDDHFTMTEAFLEVTPAPHVPIVLASQSPKMLALGGRAADAVMISTFADPGLFSEAVGWARSGVKCGHELDVAQQVIARIDVAIDEDRARARDALRPLIGYLLVLLHPKWGFLDSLGVTVPDELTAMCAARDYAGMRANLQLIPDGLLDGFGWSGSPDEVAEQIGKLRDLGVRRFVVLPHSLDGDPIPTMRTFAEEVIRLVETAP
jgi:5,10-methylenetetrahydromethanopterin reductase